VFVTNTTAEQWCSQNVWTMHVNF